VLYKDLARACFAEALEQASRSVTE
jgi:hypothetical protein